MPPTQKVWAIPGAATSGPIVQVATSTTSAAAVAARANRHSVTFKNAGASTIYISDSATCTSSNSMPLLAGESWTVRTVIAYSCLAASGTPTLVVEEEY